MKKKPTIALMYDFDKTLAENNITLSDDVKNEMLDYIEDFYLR